MNSKNNTENNLIAGQVLHLLSDNKDYRVLWIGSGDTPSYWIPLDDSSNIPQKFSPSRLGADDYELIVDTWTPCVNENSLPKSMTDRRDKAWTLIKPIVTEEPGVYSPSVRAGLLKKAEAESGIKSNNIYLYLGRYWKRGKIPNALLPDYSRCGKSRDPYKASSKRPGRPPQKGNASKKLTQADLQNFSAAIQGHYLKNSSKSLKKTYTYLIRTYYGATVVDEVPQVEDPSKIPSIRQFRYWYSQNRDIFTEKTRREGEGTYNLKYRGTTGRTETRLMGPGSVFQIDATVADIYLVSRTNRSQIVGRPTLYFAKDAQTRMVIGMHVSLEPPSWKEAAYTIMNAIEDKPSYCKKFGIEITHEDWPCRHLPSILLADRGEVESSIADCLADDLGIAIENTPPYRGDLKGIIENHFNLINISLDHNLPGWVRKNFGERGTHDCRLDAAIDIAQFTAMIIKCVLHYNNYHWMNYYHRTPELRANMVESVPRELWNYGMRFQSGALRTLPRENVRYSLFPKGKGSITARGISFKGLTYTCDKAMSEHWFDIARTSGSQDITVAYDPFNMAAIYVKASGTEPPVECVLLEHDSFYAGMQSAEVESDRKADLALEAERSMERLNADLELDSFIEKTKTEAIRQTKDQATAASKASRIRDINSNRQAEIKAAARDNTVSSLESPGVTPPAPDAPDSKKHPETTPVNALLRRIMKESLSKEVPDNEQAPQ